MRNILKAGPGALALTFFLGACSVFGGKAAEEPSYRIVLKDDKIEVRAYENFAVAWTKVSGDFDKAVATGFRRIFKYITGSNLGETKIEMTAPVLTTPREAGAGETVFPEPSRSSDAGRVSRLAGTGIEAWSTGFILPSGYTTATAPRPASSTIFVTDVESRCMASIRFSGFLDNEKAEGARQTLARWIEARGLEHLGDWMVAGYNPPWTIPVLRRNEVLVTLRSC